MESNIISRSLIHRKRSACYNIKCNTRKKYRQYSYQGVKCSHHNKQLHGGKNIVLHTFYTIRTILSTGIFKSRKKFSRNCKITGKKSLNDQPRDQKKLEQKEEKIQSLESNNSIYYPPKKLCSQTSYTKRYGALSVNKRVFGKVLVSRINSKSL